MYKRNEMKRCTRNAIRNITTGTLSLILLFSVSCSPAATETETGDLYYRNYVRAVKEKNFYESEDRDQWQRPDTIIDLLKSSALQGESKEWVVADIGAGTGYFTVRLLPHFSRTIAIDISDKWIKYLEERIQELSGNFPEYTRRIEIRKTKSGDPGLKPAEVHGVLLSNSYHHLENRVSYLKKVHRGMKPGSRIVIVDFLEIDRPVGPPPGHGLIPPAQIIKELKQSGFVIVDHPVHLPYQTVIVGKKE